MKRSEAKQARIDSFINVWDSDRRDALVRCAEAFGTDRYDRLVEDLKYAEEGLVRVITRIINEGED